MSDMLETLIENVERVEALSQCDEMSAIIQAAHALLDEADITNRLAVPGGGCTPIDLLDRIRMLIDERNVYRKNVEQELSHATG